MTGRVQTKAFVAGLLAACLAAGIGASTAAAATPTATITSATAYFRTVAVTGQIDPGTQETTFYAEALGATVVFASPGWTSLRIAGVRVALALDASHTGTPMGLHFAVSDLAAVRAAIARAGGATGDVVEVAPGVILVDATDTEGNSFTITPRE